MNRKCLQHQFNECEFLYFKPTAKNVLICSVCIDESNGNIKMADCVALKQILEANSETIIQRYPPLSSSEINQMVLHFSGSIDKELKQIKEYFQKLLRSYETIVQKAMDKSRAQINQLIKLRESMVKKYAEIAQIDKLKQLVAQSQSDQNSDAQLLRFIQDKSKEATANANKIMPSLMELQQYRESFSLEQPQQQSKSLQEIEDIIFFNKGKNPINTTTVNIIPKQNNQRRSIINQINITPSRYLEQSKENLKINRVNNQIEIKLIKDWGQCTFESELNLKKNYILTLKTIVGNREKPQPYFYFGIMPFGLRHDEKVQYQGICYNEIIDSFGIAKMIKGTQLHLGEDCEDNMQNIWRLKGERRFEIRVNLEKRIVKVGSLPDYKLVAQMDDLEMIDLYQQYTFAMLNYGNENNNIILEDICEVDSFDGLM